MTADGFELWLGQIAQEQPFRHQVHKALSVAGGWRNSSGNRARGFNGSRIGRGFAIGRILTTSDRHSGPRSRRVVVKVRIVRLRGNGTAAAAHLRYLQRDGTTRDGERGTLYSAGAENADGHAFLKRGREDRHHFRFVVSPEDGAEYDELKPMIRRLMAQAETDLETKLDWVGVDHFNTGHPHSHILVGGKDDMGKDLIIAPDYVTIGLRNRATDLVNLDLGPRGDLEMMRANLCEMEQERFTGVDRRLLEAKGADGLVSTRDFDGVEQSLRAGRLATLSRMGLAVEERKGRWRLSDRLEPTLRDMGKRADKIATLDRQVRSLKITVSRADYAIYDPSSHGAQPIVGRVAARGLSDEQAGREYLIVEGIDGRAHYVEIGLAGGEHDFDDAIVSISPARPVQIERLTLMPLEQMPEHDGITWLDEHAGPSRAHGRTGTFGWKVADAMVRRRQWLIEQGLAEKPDKLDVLRRRELQRVADQISRELDSCFVEAKPGGMVEGSYRRSVYVGAARMAVIENSREFTLVAWGPELHRQLGKEVSGIMRGSDISWTFGRQRSSPEI